MDIIALAAMKNSREALRNGNEFDCSDATWDEITEAIINGKHLSLRVTSNILLGVTGTVYFSTYAYTSIPGTGIAQVVFDAVGPSLPDGEYPVVYQVAITSQGRTYVKAPLNATYETWDISGD